MSETLEAVKETLRAYGQEHLLLKYSEMSDEGKKHLLDQIKDIDFEQMKTLYEATKHEVETGGDRIEPISFVNQFTMPESEKAKYIKAGEAEIRAGKLGFITMAGGQRNKTWT